METHFHIGAFDQPAQREAARYALEVVDRQPRDDRHHDRHDQERAQQQRDEPLTGREPCARTTDGGAMTSMRIERLHDERRAPEMEGAGAMHAAAARIDPVRDLAILDHARREPRGRRVDRRPRARA